VAMDSELSSRINLVILDGAHDFRSTFNTGSDEICKQVRLVALFGRDRRVGECLLLREERKSGLRDPISVLAPLRHPECAERYPSLRAKRKTYARTEFFSVRPGTDIQTCRGAWAVSVGNLSAAGHRALRYNRRG
jgi:hypothetical protein